MDLRELGKALLYPPIAILLLLTPIACALLIEALYMIAVGTKKLKRWKDLNEKSENNEQ